MTAKSKILSQIYKKEQCLQKRKRKINPAFTKAIRTAKLIRACAAFMPADRSRFYRLSTFILHHVIQKDGRDPTGERQICAQDLKVFEGYEFNPEKPLHRYMPADVHISIKNTIQLSIPQPAFIWPEDGNFCKIIVLAVKIDLQSFTTITSIAGSPWINRNDITVSPVCIEIDRQCPLLIAIGINFTNNRTRPLSYSSVKIAAVIL